MGHNRLAYIVLVSVVLLSGALFFWDTPVHFLESVIGENKLIGSVVFVMLMFLATVIAPITVLPTVPVVAPVLGPFLTGTLSVIGWTTGAVVAFLLARYAGRPFLGRFVSLSTLERYESHVPKDAQFMSIVLLRMVLPVDILSYALGLFSTITLSKYTMATAIGVTYFSYAFAYMGSAAHEHNITILIVIASISLVILSYLLYRNHKKKIIRDKDI